MRYLLLISLLFLLAIASFEFSFFYVEKNFSLEFRTFNKALAKQVKFYIFRNKKLTWIIGGDRAVFINNKSIHIDNFFAKSKLFKLEAFAETAQIFLKKKEILLQRNVFISFIHKGKLTTVTTNKAILDLKRNVIYGNSPVLIKEGMKKIKGRGFKFLIKDDILKIYEGITSL
ncbi:MAG TPA: LPS export ABC transporter periplasmic protein LptC [Aquificales bacterium]|nr:LPS export ABC transporter periplasmic protein LptC [Aquificales bacterium]